jgi:hypothetical protein
LNREEEASERSSRPLSLPLRSPFLRETRSEDRGLGYRVPVMVFSSRGFSRVRYYYEGAAAGADTARESLTGWRRKAFAA